MFISLLFREQTADDLGGDDLGGLAKNAWGCAGRVLMAMGVALVDGWRLVSALILL